LIFLEITGKSINMRKQFLSIMIILAAIGSTGTEVEEPEVLKLHSQDMTRWTESNPGMQIQTVLFFDHYDKEVEAAYFKNAAGHVTYLHLSPEIIPIVRPQTLYYVIVLVKGGMWPLEFVSLRKAKEEDIENYYAIEEKTVKNLQKRIKRS